MHAFHLHGLTHVGCVAWAFVALGICVSAWSDQPSERTAAELASFRAAVQYQSMTRSDPRPLRIHVLRVELRASDFELAVAIGEDPDGDGPVEATLTSPRVLATRAGLVAAVNTNPWTMIPPTMNGLRTPYVAGLGCDIAGWAVSDGRVRSAPQAGNWNFWSEELPNAEQAPGIQTAASHSIPKQPVRVGLGEQPARVPVRQAVAWFGGLVRHG